MMILYFIASAIYLFGMIIVWTGTVDVVGSRLVARTLLWPVIMTLVLMKAMGTEIYHAIKP